MTKNTMFKVYAILGISTGTISLIGSSLLIHTILQSKKKLSIPYRRIIFGISVFDIFQSIALTSNIFLSPKGSRPWAIGNTTTCDIQGFVLTTGGIAVGLYLLSLCIYYFCVLRLNMTIRVFRKIEPFLHIVSISYSIFYSTYAWANEYFNPYMTVCMVTAVPEGCETDPDQECTRGEGALRFLKYFLIYPTVPVFLVICGIMATIVHSVKKVERRNRRYSIPYIPDRKQASALQMFSARFRTSEHQVSNVDEESNDNTNNLDGTSRSVSNRQRRKFDFNASKTREINKQALLFIGSFAMAYVFLYLEALYPLMSGNEAPQAIRILLSIFFPLQGFFNILIFCRPHIISLRRRYPGEYTWFQAFRVVLKSGGDSCHNTVAAERQKERRSDERMLVEDEYDSSFEEGEITQKSDAVQEADVDTQPNAAGENVDALNDTKDENGVDNLPEP